MKQKILLSIICPAYNAEKTIQKLIDSIENQKFKNYELILLNDGSIDSTLKIMNKNKNAYSNIKVVNKKNTGVSDTRNIGLKIAKGEFIAFADSDDYYSENFFSEIVPLLKLRNFELLFFDAYVMHDNQFSNDLISEKYKIGYFNEENGVEKYLQGKYCHQIGNVPWNKIYVNNIIKNNNMMFNVNKKFGEDLLFNILYVSKIKKYKYVNKKLYYYNLNTNVNTTHLYRKSNYNEDLIFFDEVKKICNNNQINDSDQYLVLFFLRRFPSLVLKEIDNPLYDDGKKSINNYLNLNVIKKLFSNIKFKYFDLRLFICYIFYKLKLYIVYYYIKWHLRHFK